MRLTLRLAGARSTRTPLHPPTGTKKKAAFTTQASIVCDRRRRARMWTFVSAGALPSPQFGCSNREPVRVLIADDERGVGQTLADFVRRCGHEVVDVVASGLAAI